MFVTRLTILIAALLLPASPAVAGTPEVLVSIKPLHAIVAAVMEGVAVPRLLVKGAASPHDYAMRPSDAAALEDADLVFWIGGSYEAFLIRPLRALAGKARLVTVMETVGDGTDPHVWLDPANGLKIAALAAAALVSLDPANGDRYRANYRRFAVRLERLDGELRAALAPVAGKPYLVFHDAYGYFERAYGLNRLAAVTLNPQRRPGAGRLATLRALILDSGARCLFGEPQFTPALLDTLVEGSDARIAVLDPLGAALPAGADAYFTLLENLADDLRNCLTAADGT